MTLESHHQLDDREMCFGGREVVVYLWFYGSMKKFKLNINMYSKLCIVPINTSILFIIQLFFRVAKSENAKSQEKQNKKLCMSNLRKSRIVMTELRNVPGQLILCILYIKKNACIYIGVSEYIIMFDKFLLILWMSTSPKINLEYINLIQWMIFIKGDVSP